MVSQQNTSAPPAPGAGEMNDIGLLWRDESGRPFEKRLALASDYYRNQYGVHPNRCFVNPVQWNVERSYVAGMVVEPSRYVLFDTYWLGIDKAR